LSFKTGLSSYYVLYETYYYCYYYYKQACASKQNIFTLRTRPILSYDDDDDDKPVWPTWAVGALFRGARRIHINRECFHITPPSLRSQDIIILSYGGYHTRALAGEQQQQQQQQGKGASASASGGKQQKEGLGVGKLPNKAAKGPNAKPAAAEATGGKGDFSYAEARAAMPFGSGFGLFGSRHGGPSAQPAKKKKKGEKDKGGWFDKDKMMAIETSDWKPGKRSQVFPRSGNKSLSYQN
jgi:hypothetical protein